MVQLHPIAGGQEDDGLAPALGPAGGAWAGGTRLLAALRGGGQMFGCTPLNGLV